MTTNLNNKCNDSEKPLSLREACAFLGVTRDTLYRYIKKGLPCYQPIKKLYFLKKELLEWVTGGNHEKNN